MTTDPPRYPTVKGDDAGLSRVTRRLPKVIATLGGVWLAGVAGWVNASMLGLGLLPVTHVTGTVSRLSVDVARADTPDASAIIGVVAAFMAGAAVSGAIIGTPTLRIGRRYGVTMLIEGVLIAAAIAAIHAGHSGAGLGLLAASAGLQNAMASSYAGLIVRTTHVTGIVTDLGFKLGRFLTRREVEPWRALLLVALLGGFFAGGFAGIEAQNRMGLAALAIPAASLIAVGSVYFVWRHCTRTDATTPTSPVRP